MRNVALAIVGVAVLIGALYAPTLVARRQSLARFEYLELSPGLSARGGSAQRLGYTACAATATSEEWACREFESPKSLSNALQVSLSTLGNEGWELVAVMDGATNPWGDPTLKDYLFKRQRPQ